MSVQGFFPFIPHYTTWEDWNGNLIMYYSEEPIPYTSEEDWKTTVKNMIALPTFLSAPIPDPELYEHWEDWVNQFNLILNGKTT